MNRRVDRDLRRHGSLLLMAPSDGRPRASRFARSPALKVASLFFSAGTSDLDVIRVFILMSPRRFDCRNRARCAHLG